MLVRCVSCCSVVMSVITQLFTCTLKKLSIMLVKVYQAG